MIMFCVKFDQTAAGESLAPSYDKMRSNIHNMIIYHRDPPILDQVA